jgi:hypothetical protein
MKLEILILEILKGSRTDRKGRRKLAMQCDAMDANGKSMMELECSA